MIVSEGGDRGGGHDVSILAASALKLRGCAPRTNEVARRKRARMRDPDADREVEHRHRVLALAQMGGSSHDADRRRRMVELARMRIALDVAMLSPAERARVERARVVARLRRGP